MTRIQLSLAVTLILFLQLAACAAPQPEAQPAPISTFAASQPGQVSFMVFGDPAERKAYQDLVAAFEQKHPSIAIELIHIPGQEDYRKRMVADFVAGTPVDVMLINYRRYADFAARGALEPLEPYLERSTRIKASDFYPEAMRPFYWERQLMCIPQNISSLVVYYNEDLFDAAGVPYPGADWTRDEFLATALALTKDLDGDGRVDQHGLGVDPTLIRAAPFIWQNRGSLVKTNLVPIELALDEPPALLALQWFVDLQVKHHVVPDAVEEQSEDGESRFLNGRLAMYLNSRRGVPAYREAARFDWDVAPLPRDHGRQFSVLHADGYCMAAAAKDKAAAWTFIEYANSPEGQTIVAQSGRTVPSLIAVAESPAFLDPNARPAHNRVFLDTIPSLRAMPVIPNWGDIEEIAGYEIERSFYGRASVIEAVQAAILHTEQYFAPLSR